MISPGRLILVTLIAARAADSQTVLSPRDSTALVEVVIADLRAHYRILANGAFVFDTTNASLGPLTVRVLAALRARDTVPAAPATRTTPRARLSNFTVVGDTVSISVWVSQCTFEPREWVSSASVSHRFFRTNGTWSPERQRSVNVGDSTRCPYFPG